jgi:hypothetical protein
VDEQIAAANGGQLDGFFLLDREGIVRWAHIEGAKAGLAHVIGLGSPGGAKIPVVDDHDHPGFFRDDKGKEVVTRLDGDLLADVGWRCLLTPGLDR